MGEPSQNPEMHQAQVTTWGQPPKYISCPALPEPASDQIQLKILAAGAHRVVQSRAAGKHYSAKTLPHTPGTDAVGVELRTGKKYYFNDFASGTMREYSNVPKSALTPLPEGLDPIQAAGLINPALSSWMALKTRATPPEAKNARSDAGFTVLLLGATSASGRLAVPLARQLGASRVVGVARDGKALASLGLDEYIVMHEEVEKTDFSKLGDVDVVLDYIYGPLTEHLFRSLKSATPVQYIHIGSLSGVLDIALPGAILRSKDITIRGTGPGAWSMEQLAEAMPELLEKMKNVPSQPVRAVELQDVEKEWPNALKERLVFVP